MSDVALTNLGRPLYPNGFTKGDLVDYYRRVAPRILPFVAGRAVTLYRAPSGVAERGWYQTNCTGAPEWMRIAAVAGRRGARFRMCVIEDERSLVWAAQVGTIELHPFLWRLAEPQRPDWLVFDLDPGPPAGLAECCDVALVLRSRLASDDAWVKTSGSVGLHVLAPVRDATFAGTKARARELADGIPGTLLSQRRDLRAGRVLVDVQQNDATRSLVAPWSLRATAWPTVSMPVTWDELERTAADRRAERLVYDWRDVLNVIE
ncbi:MAG: DNA polymerase domain-containing protein [Gaiellaceae bacterium]